MPVQTGPTAYDPSLTVTEQLAELHKKLASYLASGREGTSVVEAVRQQIANLEQQQASNVATQERIKTELAAHAATNPNGTVAPGYGKPDTTEIPPKVSARDVEHAATQKAAEAADPSGIERGIVRVIPTSTKEI